MKIPTEHAPAGPHRLQVALRASDLESLLPEDHRAGLVWGNVGGHKARGRHVDRAETVRRSTRGILGRRQLSESLLVAMSPVPAVQARPGSFPGMGASGNGVGPGLRFRFSVRQGGNHA